MIRHRILTILIGILVFGASQVSGQLTAQQALSKAESKLTSAKGIVSTFKIYNSGYSGSGTIKTQGGKFSVTLPDVEVWYNGKEMYTYNKRAGETTVVLPTSEELSESNPLAYVSGAGKKYNVSFSTVKKSGKYVLELVPKTKGNVRRITLTLKNTDYTPEKIVVEPNSGNPVSADIITFKTEGHISSGEFEYPKSKYPKAEIIDLR